MKTRTRHLLAAAVLAGALAACSSPAPEQTPAPSSPSPTAGTSDDAAVEAWADDVCTSLTAVRTATSSIGDDLQVNPLDGAAALDDARAQIQANIAEVGTAVADLRATIGDAPDVPAAQEAKEAFQGSLDEFEAAQAAVAQQAGAAASAENVADFLTAAGGALSAVSEAGAAVGDLYRSVTGEGSGVRAEVRAAFQAAPACQAL